MGIDEKYMKLAMEEAAKAEKLGEVPIGAVIVYKDRVIGKGYNQREMSQTTLSHAELIAIGQANNEMGSWRLEDCCLYVTLEPCPMCAGAIVQSRLKRVIYGATDPKAGCAGTLMNLLQEGQFNHQVEITKGVMQRECAALLTDFFQKLRREKKKNM